MRADPPGWAIAALDVAQRPSAPRCAPINAAIDRMSASPIGPFGVKHFQTIHHCSVDVAHGLVLLF